MEKMKPFDVVALLKEFPGQSLKKGQVGTVIRVWEKGVFEVEFVNEKGETLAVLPVVEKDLF